MQHTEPAKQQTDLLQSTETEITLKLIYLVIDLGDGVGSCTRFSVVDRFT